MPNYQRHIVYLSDEQREELFTNGTITVNGQTITYSDNDMYVTPQETPYVKPATGIPASDLAEGAIPAAPVQDVQVNGASILQNGIANIPVANASAPGVAKVVPNNGITIVNGALTIYAPGDQELRQGANAYRPVTPNKQHASTFYGLAKAAGDTTQAQSSNEVGTYTSEAKDAIRSMIGAADADELNDKANRDGYYSEMSVGNAEQLVSSKFVEDQEPYTLRPAGGSADIGNRENLTAIVGGTLAWNQQVRDEASDNTTDFADIVTVDDAVADNAGVRVKIEPVQDLHGYDHPWPAGGGKNLFNQEVYSNISAYSVSFSSYYYTEPPLTLKPNTQYTFSPDSNADLDAGLYFAIRTKDGDAFSSEDVYIYPVYNGSVTTSTRHTITTGSTGKIVFGLPNGSDAAGRLSKIMSKNWQLEEGSTATSWTPYSNICPVEGWTGVDIFTAGENLVPAEDKDYTGANAYTRLTCENGIFTLANNSSYPLGVTALISQQSGTVETVFGKRKRLLPGTYSFSVEITGLVGLTNVTNISLRLTNYIVEDKVSIANGGTFTITEPLDIRAIACQCVGGYPVGASISFKVQLERSTSPSTWKPYSGQTYSITLPSEAGTVYGCKLTVNEDGTGILKVDRAEVDLGTLTWDTATTDTAGKNRFVANIPGIKIGNANQVKLICSEYNEIIGTYSYGSLGIAPHGTVARVLVADYTRAEMTATEFKSAMSGAQLIYELADPITYPLTASQVTTLLGTNNVWSDAGQLSLTYKGTDEHLTLTDGRKYLTRINGVDSMVLGAGQALTAVKGRDNVFDLTQMFGTAAVADYVYGQGAGYFRKWFPNGLYAYNPGELKSVEGLQSHDTVGFNLWDEEWEVGGISKSSGGNVDQSRLRSKNHIPLIVGQTYNLHNGPIGNISFYWYDANKNYVSNISMGTAKDQTFVAVYPYLRFVEPNITAYSNDICINLVNSGSRNGEYEPYEKHSYPLDSSLTLRGIPKAGANGIYWDGDQYLPDGTVERIYGVVDLGSLTWTYDSTYHRFNTVIISAKTAGTARVEPIACAKYTPIRDRRGVANVPDKSIYRGTDHDLSVHDSAYTDAAAFKAAMSGVYLVYELATPITETADPYRELQQVDDWGTEEFVSTGLVPVGHVTQYPANLRDKLQHLPDLASSNGIFLVRQTDSEMELLKLPDMPTANGNYRLKLNVASGSPTFSWEAVT